MADQKISQLNNITGADVDDATDELAIVDASANETKAITRGELFASVSKITTDAAASDIAIKALRPYNSGTGDPVVIVAGDGDSGDVLLEMRGNNDATLVDTSDTKESADAKFIFYGNGASTFNGPLTLNSNATITGNITAETNLAVDRALVTTRTGLTISSGAVTATGSYHTIDTEASAATDDLDTINGAFATGHRLVITAANSGRTVVVKDGTGNIVLSNPLGNFSMDNATDTMELIWSGSNWLELSRSYNGT